MSSSADPPGWDAFADREVTGELELLSPASELAAALQHIHADLMIAREETAAAQRDGLSALAGMAVLVVQFGAALARYEDDLDRVGLKRPFRHLRVLKDQMLDALNRAGLEIDSPIGQGFDNVSESVLVDGWRHGADFPSEVVAEVIEPIVRSRGALVRPGRVVMGAPLEQAIHDGASDGPATAST